MSVAKNKKATSRQRITAMAEAPLAVTTSDANLQAVIGVVRNQDEPVGSAPRRHRHARDGRLQRHRLRVRAATTTSRLARGRGRSESPDPPERARLAGGRKGRIAQKKLLKGLKDPEKALVPPEKALQLLGNDMHSEAYAIARAC